MKKLTHPHLLAAFTALKMAGWRQAERGLTHAENWVNNRIPIEILGDCRAVIRFVCSQNQVKAPWHDPEVVIRDLLPLAFAAIEPAVDEPAEPPSPPSLAKTTKDNPPKPFPKAKK